MRAVALIAALACASAAHADGVRESRYGPAPDRPPVPLNGQGPGFNGPTYSGQMLGWGGKREIVAPEVQAQPVQQPWWAQQQPQVAPQPQQPAQRYVPQAQYQPQQPQYPQPAPQPQQAYASAPRPLPQTIYDAPRSAPSGAPTQVAYAAPVPQEEPQQRTLQPGQVGARTYSVGRQFGMSPDPIPAAGPPRLVLIAPPATAPDDDKPREDDDRDWPSPSGKSKKDSDQ